MTSKQIEAIMPTDEELLEMGVDMTVDKFEGVEGSDEEELFKAGFRD